MESIKNDETELYQWNWRDYCVYYLCIYYKKYIYALKEQNTGKYKCIDIKQTMSKKTYMPEHVLIIMKLHGEWYEITHTVCLVILLWEQERTSEGYRSEKRQGKRHQKIKVCVKQFHLHKTAWAWLSIKCWRLLSLSRACSGELVFPLSIVQWRCLTMLHYDTIRK